MIAIKIQGRLGNQLFQYAFIYSTAKKFNTTFYLDKSIEDFKLTKYFEVEHDNFDFLHDKLFSIKGYKNIFRIHLKKYFYWFVQKFLFQERKLVVSNQMPVENAYKLLKPNYFYEGFFQSESYFENCKEAIRDLFKIKNKYIKEFEEIFKKFNSSKKKAVVHFRRSDYIDLDIALPINYFKKAIEIIGISEVDYIFISDDPLLAEAEFNYIPNKYISTNNEIIDLQFLINADICILSNSSYSWWGAWLNTKLHKQVYAPKYWMGFKEKAEYPNGISNNLIFNWIDV